MSVKTRAPRPQERHGREYFFVDDAAFDRMIEEGDLLEWAPFTDHRSGTPRAFVQDALGEGRDVLLELDVEGARQVRAHAPGLLLIFVEPPSFEVLEARLRGRGTEDAATIARRLGVARREMDERGWFDRVVVNDDLQRAVGRGRCYHRGVPHLPG